MEKQKWKIQITRMLTHEQWVSLWGDTHVGGGGWASLTSPTCSYHHHPTELDTRLSPQGNAVLGIWREPWTHKFESRDWVRAVFQDHVSGWIQGKAFWVLQIFVRVCKNTGFPEQMPCPYTDNVSRLCEKKRWSKSEKPEQAYETRTHMCRFCTRPGHTHSDSGQHCPVPWLSSVSLPVPWMILAPYWVCLSCGPFSIY